MSELEHSDDHTARCHDCGRPYGHENGFPDLIIPYDYWRRISPTGDEGGLLCPSCICQRLHDRGLRCAGAFMSGPIDSVSYETMNNQRRVENIELAIRGRDNEWGVAMKRCIEQAVDETIDRVKVEETEQ